MQNYEELISLTASVVLPFKEQKLPREHWAPQDSERKWSTTDRSQIWELFQAIQQ